MSNSRSTDRFLRSHSIYGTGLRWMSFEYQSPDLVYTTLWIAVAYVPLVPVQRRICQYRGTSSDMLGHEVDSPIFQSIERVPLSLGSVLLTYGWAVCVVAFLFGPLAFMIVWTNQRAAQPLEIGFILFWIVLVGLFPFWRANRERGILERSRGLEYAERMQAWRAQDAKAGREHWRRTQYFPFWVYLVAMIVGGLPGYLIANQLGWNLELQKLVGALCGFLAAGAVYWLDRVLMKGRKVEPVKTFDKSDEGIENG